MNIHIEFRQPFIKMAKNIGFPIMAIVFDTPLELCIYRNKIRPNRQFDEEILHEQYAQFKVATRNIEIEGFQSIINILD